MPSLHILKISFLIFIVKGYPITSEISLDIASDESFSVSTNFPTPEDALEFIHLSYAVQEFQSCEEIEIEPTFPDGAKCEYYQETLLGTEAMIVTSSVNEYIGVLFGGSDQLRDWLVDVTIEKTLFGPPEHPIENDVRVHLGFNDALFYDGIFYILLQYVRDLHHKYPTRRIFSSGHSLGGALSQLMAAGISHYMPHVFINNPSYGAPRVGGKTWFNYLNDNPKIGNWRYVYDDDIVPRLWAPVGPEYFHVGHTFQLNTRDVKVYYLHYGDDSLNYAGVLESWNLRGLTNVTKGWDDHEKINYIEYFELKSLENPDQFWADGFLNCTTITCPGSASDIDDYNTAFSVEAQ